MRPERLAAALCLLVVLAGCTSAPVPETTVSPTTTTTQVTTTATDRNVTGYETLAVDSLNRYPFVEGGIAIEGDPGTDERHHLTVVATRADADRLNYSAIDEGGAVRTFVEDTDFSAAVLVVFEEFPDSSVPDYRVETVRQRGESLRIRVNDSSSYGTDDVTVEHLLVRVPWEGPEPPDRVVVVTEDGREFAWPTDGG